MYIVVDLIMYALQCNMMTWQFFSFPNTRGVTIVVAHIFSRATMEKTISPCPLAVAGEEEEINP
jgi:hypothetical protein